MKKVTTLLASLALGWCCMTMTAAAATVAVMNLTSVANPHIPKIIHFDANHPFMFMIIDNKHYLITIFKIFSLMYISLTISLFFK